MKIAQFPYISTNTEMTTERKTACRWNRSKNTNDNWRECEETHRGEVTDRQMCCRENVVILSFI
jgi:hypothetical protein